MFIISVLKGTSQNTTAIVEYSQAYFTDSSAAAVKFDAGSFQMRGMDAPAVIKIHSLLAQTPPVKTKTFTIIMMLIIILVKIMLYQHKGKYYLMKADIDEHITDDDAHYTQRPK